MKVILVNNNGTTHTYARNLTAVEAVEVRADMEKYLGDSQHAMLRDIKKIIIVP